MTKSFLLYIVLAMIAYDLSVHLVYLFKKEKFFLKKKINYWPEWKGRKYQIFWTTYWGIAVSILLIYIFS